MAYRIHELSPSEDSGPEIIVTRAPRASSRRSRSAAEPRDSRRSRRHAARHEPSSYLPKSADEIDLEDIYAHERRPRTTSRRTDCDGEDALNELYGGQTVRPVALQEPTGLYEDRLYGRPGRQYSRPVGAGAPPAAGLYEPELRYGRGRHSTQTAAIILDPDVQFLERRPRGKSQDGFWDRAARREKGRLRFKVRLIVSRKGRRYQSEAFHFTVGEKATGIQGDDDYYLAGQIKKRYARLKSSQIGLMQKIIAYRTIAYVYVLQYRCRVVDSRWQVTDHVPITTKDDDEGRANFMYLLRNNEALKDRPTWAGTLENRVIPGAVIDLEVIETFDSIKIYWGLLFAILLSLGAALAYGFTMDNDFSTGFSIASWMITAFGFFAAVVAAGEYFGLERPNSFAAVSQDLNAGDERPRIIHV